MNSSAFMYYGWILCATVSIRPTNFWAGRLLVTFPLKLKWMADLYIAVTDKNATLVDIDLFSSEESGCFELIFRNSTP